MDWLVDHLLFTGSVDLIRATLSFSVFDKESVERDHTFASLRLYRIAPSCWRIQYIRKCVPNDTRGFDARLSSIERVGVLAVAVGTVVVLLTLSIVFDFVNR